MVLKAAFSHAFMPYFGVYDLATKSIDFTTSDFGFPNGTIAAHPSGRYLATAASTGVIILDFFAADPYVPLEGWPTENATAVAFSADGTRLAVGYASGGVKVYDFETKAEIWAELALTIHDIAFSPDGLKLALTHTASPRLRVYNAATGVEDTGWPVMATPGPKPRCRWSPDGNWLVYVGGKGASVSRSSVLDTTTKVRNGTFGDYISPTNIAIDGTRVIFSSSQQGAGGNGPRIYSRQFSAPGTAETGWPAPGYEDLRVALSPDGATLYATTDLGFRSIDVASKVVDDDWPTAGGLPPQDLVVWDVPVPEVPEVRRRRALNTDDIPEWAEEPEGSMLVVGEGGILEWAPPAP